MIADTRTGLAGSATLCAGPPPPSLPLHTLGIQPSLHFHAVSLFPGWQGKPPPLSLQERQPRLPRWRVSLMLCDISLRACDTPGTRPAEAAPCSLPWKLLSPGTSTCAGLVLVGSLQCTDLSLLLSLPRQEQTTRLLPPPTPQSQELQSLQGNWGPQRQLVQPWAAARDLREVRGLQARMQCRRSCEAAAIRSIVPLLSLWLHPLNTSRQAGTRFSFALPQTLSCICI